jgi:predicted transcriptional regulator
MTKHITFALSDAELEHLSELAQRGDTDLKGAMSTLIQESVERDEWLKEIIEEGLEDIRQGRTLSHEEVVELGRQRREELLAKKAS